MCAGPKRESEAASVQRGLGQPLLGSSFSCVSIRDNPNSNVDINISVHVCTYVSSTFSLSGPH